MHWCFLIPSPWSEIQVDQPHSIQQEYCWTFGWSTREKILNSDAVLKLKPIAQKIGDRGCRMKTV